MVLNRLALRDLYIGRFFKVSELTLKPQYDLLILFVIILLIGLAAEWYMVRTMISASEGRESL